MATAGLPLELQQEIFSYLDSRSFYAARKVCRWWRLASFDSVTLRRQLQKLPIKPAVDARETEPQELYRLYAEAAKKLLLGVTVSQREDEPTSMAAKSSSGLFARPRIAAVMKGSRTVTINGGQLAVFDMAQEPPEVLLQRPLDDAIEAVRRIPWLNIAPAASYGMALSADGSTLAVGQERTIHIYDLAAGPNAPTVSRTIASAAGHYIIGLEFEQDDRLLRVQLSAKGVVLYLGTPEASAERTRTAGIAYWRSAAGLGHTFLDSSALQLPRAPSAAQYEARLGGLQLLRPFQDGYLFAAQSHGGNESSHYTYGHVRATSVAGRPAAIDPESVVEIAKLESFHSAWDYGHNHQAESGTGSWADMPSAHEHHPKFAMSEDGGVLALAEREKKHIRHVKWTQLFLYQLPTVQKAGETMTDRQEREEIRWKRLARFLNPREERNGTNELGDVQEKREQKYVVARVPLSIGTFEGEATELRLEKADAASAATYVVTVETEQRRRKWQLVEI